MLPNMHVNHSGVRRNRCCGSISSCARNSRRSLTNSCDFLRWLPVMPPLRIGGLSFFFFFFIDVSHRADCTTLSLSLSSSRGDKYLTSRSASSQLAAIAWNRDGGRCGFIALNNRDDRHCCVRRFEGGAALASSNRPNANFRIYRIYAPLPAFRGALHTFGWLHIGPRYGTLI